MIPAALRDLKGPRWPRWQWARMEDAGWDVGLIAEPGLQWFQGHFEGHPVLPGVVQTHIAGTLARLLFKPAGAFSGIGNLKFQQIVLPGQAMVLALRPFPGKPAIDFTLRYEEEVFSRGRLRFEGPQ